MINDKENIDKFISKFDSCLELVEYGTDEYRRDTAFSMVKELVRAKPFGLDVAKSILVGVAYHAALDRNVIDNLTDNPSSGSMHTRYYFYKNMLPYLASISFLNLNRVQSVFDSMNEPYQRFSGGSPMQDSVYNVRFYGENCYVLEKCLDALKKAQ